MASTSHPNNGSAPAATKNQLPSSDTVEKSAFEQQRDALVEEISISLEHVLQNINKLNRNLEGVIAVGNEFSSVEALWSQFEGVMAKDTEPEGETARRGDEAEGNSAEGRGA